MMQYLGLLDLLSCPSLIALIFQALSIPCLLRCVNPPSVSHYAETLYFIESENHRPLAFLSWAQLFCLSWDSKPFLPRLTYLLVTKAPLCGRTSTGQDSTILSFSCSMRYTFAPTSTLCPTDCAWTAGAETGWCFAGSRKSGFSVSCFFFFSFSFVEFIKCAVMSLKRRGLSSLELRSRWMRLLSLEPKPKRVSPSEAGRKKNFCQSARAR